MALCFIKKEKQKIKEEDTHSTETAMLCLSNIASINKTVAQANLPESDSASSPVRRNDSKPPLGSTKTIALPRKRRNSSPPRPTVVQIERIVGAGSFRDGQPGFVPLLPFNFLAEWSVLFAD